MMHRRSLVAGLIAVSALLSACASTGGASRAFTSDRITVETSGRGQDVIFIPGLSSHPDVWRSTVASLGDGYRVHLVHVRGFAGLEAGANASGPVSAPVAEEIARYIEEQNLGRPAVVGHSMGGTMGMMLAARHPDRVGKLMVVDMFPFMGAMFGGPNATRESLQPMADMIRAQMAAAPQGVVSEQTRATIESMVATESARPELIEHARTSNNPTVANAFAELIVTDLRPELPRLTMPTRVLYVIPPQAPITREQYIGYMEMSFASAPNKTIALIDNSRHFIMIDAHDRFVQDLRAFLAE